MDSRSVSEGIQHIAVFANGKVFKMDVIDGDGSPFSPSRLESTSEAILNDKSDMKLSPNQTSEISHLPAGTALNRTKWATARDQLKKDNLQSLEIIESALIHVWFDKLENGKSVKDLCKRGLHGDGSNIWFDKSYTYVFLQDGQFVLNIEHAWADGAVTCHVCEETNVIEHLLVEYHPQTGKIISNEPKHCPNGNEFELLLWSNLDNTLEMI